MRLVRDIYKIISFLLGYCRGIRYVAASLAMAIVTGVASGASQIALIAVISSSLSNYGAGNKPFVLSFVLLCVTAPVCMFVSDTLLIHLSTRVAMALRIQLSHKILSAPLRLIEELGSHRLLAAMTEDIHPMVNALTTLPAFLMQSATVIGCLVYLGWLSWGLLLYTLVFMVVGIVTYELPGLKALGYARLSRQAWDTLFKHLQGLTQGVKELKLHSRRRSAFLAKNLEPATEDLRRYNVAGSVIYSAANRWGQMSTFVLIGLFLFLRPVEASAQMLTGSILGLLYLAGALRTIMDAFPTFNRASVAVQRIEQLGISLKEKAVENGATALSMPDSARECFELIELMEVTHTYSGENENEVFTLGPINLTFHPPELVFITGGNGSGKTTLAKLIVGLYDLESGSIRFNGRFIEPEGKSYYCQHFSMVFSDFYLFDSLLGLDTPNLDTRARDYLSRLQLDNKLQIKNGVFSTINLSQGQRKRLALLAALMEDRPIYIFDEWAADQDPVFKEIFYLELLPALKASGKTVIVISHDDRYYHVADRIIKLDCGRVVSDQSVNLVR